MDYSLYHPDWKDIIRPEILKRDQYKCKICKVKHKSRVYKSTNQGYVECDDFMEQWAVKQGKKVFTLYLQIAHLNHDKSNNEPSNLATLCPIHHARHDKEHKKFQRIIFKSKVQSKTNGSTNKINLVKLDFLAQIQREVRQATSVQIDKSNAEALLKIGMEYASNLNK